MNPVEQIFANAFSITTTKEKPVKTTTKARKHTVKPVAVEAPAVAEIVEAPVDIVAVTASAVAEVINYDGAVENAKQALRTACIATAIATNAKVSLRDLEKASKVAGKLISKTQFSRYSKVGAQLIVDPSLDADALLTKVYNAEKASAKKASKPAKVTAPAEGSGEGGEGEGGEVVALTLAEIVAQLTEHGAVAIADVTANLIASLQDDHEVFATLAVALLRASANTVPLEQQDRGNLFNASADALSA